MNLRYARQTKIVPQEKLRNSVVLVAGVGGLGGFAAIYLALAGVGSIVLLDYDIVEESNLNRQVLYRSDDVGKKKVFIAARRLKEINPEVNVVPIDGKIGETDIPSVDIVVDGLDNIESRFRAEEFALNHNIPYVFGAVEEFMGMVTFIDKDTKKLKEFIPALTSHKPQVLAATASFIASLQSLEVIKYLTGKGDLLKNRLLVYDALSTNFMEVKL